MEDFPPLKMQIDYNFQELVHLGSTNLLMPGSPSRFHDPCSCMEDGADTSEKNLSPKRWQRPVSSFFFFSTILPEKDEKQAVCWKTESL